ncbi:MAG: NAD(P)/FAD-dependent oxidoreductase [archaeon]|nr:NAD(P)/FAD-dependent oxidoreductase [archaeon]
MDLYDVIIIGAGPAGGSAAIHCARNGLKTLVLEEHEIIGEPVHCGECLSKYAVENTGIKPPESVISEHVKGVRVIFPDGTNSVLNEEGYVLEKEKFEQWLSEEAKKKGAEIKLGTRLQKMERKNDLWEVETSKGNFYSKIIIDASGVASITSRLLKLNARFEAVTGIQYELKDIPRDGYLDFYIWPKLAPEGYLWMIPKSGTRANVGLVTTERNKAREYNEEFVKKMKWDKKVNLKTFGGLIPASGPVKNTYSEGLMIIGDAAGFTSPLFEGGSHLGLKSGQMSAKVAKEAVDKNDFSKEMFSKYQKMWKTEFPDYDKLVKGKKAIYGFTNEELNIIAKEFPRDFDKFDSIAKIKFGLRVMMKKPIIITKNFLPAMNAFAYSQAKSYGW